MILIVVGVSACSSFLWCVFFPLWLPRLLCILRTRYLKKGLEDTVVCWMEHQEGASQPAPVGSKLLAKLNNHPAENDEIEMSKNQESPPPSPSPLRPHPTAHGIVGMPPVFGGLSSTWRPQDQKVSPSHVGVESATTPPRSNVSMRCLPPLAPIVVAIETPLNNHPDSAPPVQSPHLINHRADLAFVRTDTRDVHTSRAFSSPEMPPALSPLSTSFTAFSVVGRLAYPDCQHQSGGSIHCYGDDNNDGVNTGNSHNRPRLSISSGTTTDLQPGDAQLCREVASVEKGTQTDSLVDGPISGLAVHPSTDPDGLGDVSAILTQGGTNESNVSATEGSGDQNTAAASFLESGPSGGLGFGQPRHTSFDISALSAATPLKRTSDLMPVVARLKRTLGAAASKNYMAADVTSYDNSDAEHALIVRHMLSRPHLIDELSQLGKNNKSDSQQPKHTKKAPTSLADLFFERESMRLQADSETLAAVSRNHDDVDVDPASPSPSSTGEDLPDECPVDSSLWRNSILDDSRCLHSALYALPPSELVSGSAQRKTTPGQQATDRKPRELHIEEFISDKYLVRRATLSTAILASSLRGRVLARREELTSYHRQAQPHVVTHAAIPPVAFAASSESAINGPIGVEATRRPPPSHQYVAEKETAIPSLASSSSFSILPPPSKDAVAADESRASSPFLSFNDTESGSPLGYAVSVAKDSAPSTQPAPVVEEATAPLPSSTAGGTIAQLGSRKVIAVRVNRGEYHSRESSSSTSSSSSSSDLEGPRFVKTVAGLRVDTAALTTHNSDVFPLVNVPTTTPYTSTPIGGSTWKSDRTASEASSIAFAPVTPSTSVGNAAVYDTSGPSMVAPPSPHNPWRSDRTVSEGSSVSFTPMVPVPAANDVHADYRWKPPSSGSSWDETPSLSPLAPAPPPQGGEGVLSAAPLRDPEIKSGGGQTSLQHQQPGASRGAAAFLSKLKMKDSDDDSDSDDSS